MRAKRECMISLEQFERLVSAPVAKKPIDLSGVYQNGAIAEAWKAELAHASVEEQYKQIKTLLGKIIVADCAHGVKLSALEDVCNACERVIGHIRQSYLHQTQSASLPKQRTPIAQTRSLYFLLIAAYHHIACAAYDNLSAQEGFAAAKTRLLSFLSSGLSSGAAQGGVALEIASAPKNQYLLAAYRVTQFCGKLLMEFALSYRQAPRVLWRLMNDCYLKAVTLEVDKHSVGKLFGLPDDSIYSQYTRNCLASFANLFAYRRADIVNFFKILPDWIAYVHTTFSAKEHLRLFVNLQADTPPEPITPYASINPYSKNRMCLFFDTSPLLSHLERLSQSAPSAPEKRLATIALVGLNHQNPEPAPAPTRQHTAQIALGFGSAFKALADNRSFNQIVAQSKLAQDYKPLRLIEASAAKDTVRLLHKSETSVRFAFNQGDDDQKDRIACAPYAPVLGLFALKSTHSTNKHPWQLGVVCWAQENDADLNVDGRFLGRALAVCGVRLQTRDKRSQDFVQAFLLAGDESGHQTSLLLPRYHFRQGDTVVLRIDTKETTLRLEQNLLSTDDIEQYRIVRLGG